VHGVGPRSLPPPATQGSLRVIAFIMYTALAAGFNAKAGPTQVLLHVCFPLHLASCCLRVACARGFYVAKLSSHVAVL